MVIICDGGGGDGGDRGGGGKISATSRRKGDERWRKRKRSGRPRETKKNAGENGHCHYLTSKRT